MLGDSNISKRQKAVKIILGVRAMEERNPRQTVRIRTPPKLNVNAKSYDEMINWHAEEITEPRPTMAISDSDLKDIGTGEKNLEDFISKIICHSTHNEFAVADTAKKVMFRRGHKKQTIAILKGIKSRRQYNYRFKKSQFCPN